MIYITNFAHCCMKPDTMSQITEEETYCYMEPDTMSYNADYAYCCMESDTMSQMSEEEKTLLHEA